MATGTVNLSGDVFRQIIGVDRLDNDRARSEHKLCFRCWDLNFEYASFNHIDRREKIDKPG